MASWYRKDLEQEEFIIRQRGSLTIIPLRASAASRHSYQRTKIDTAVEDGQREWLKPAFVRHRGPETNLCLFNIIVAFEWMPNYNDLRLVREATTSASDLLYDVTDGYMAIGWACVGGKDLMNCADIQIFASNRLFPRSTVDGLNEQQKYQPIRLGRGLWHKNSRITLPWDSELGFATLVHEWGHYALGLKDQYLTVTGEGEQKVVVPVRNPVLDTIMANTLKTELLGDPKVSTDPASEWSGLRTHPAFLWLEIPNLRPKRPVETPPNQQPRPAFRLAGTASKDTAEMPHPVLDWNQAFEASEHKLDSKHCWVFLVEGDIESPKAIIAQGEVESIGALVDHTIDGPALQLLGAKVDHKIVLVGQQENNPLKTQENNPLKTIVLWTNILEIESRELTLDVWQDATPDSFPLLDMEAQCVNYDPPTHRLILGESSQREGWEQFVFPLGEPDDSEQRGRVWPSVGRDVTSLDGHVMLIKKNGGKPKLAIAGYSLGGSPDSGFPVHPNPIPAGSSDGNAMIFFYEQKKDDPTLDAPACSQFSYPELNQRRYQQRVFSQPPTTLSAQNGTAPMLDSYRVVVTTNYQAAGPWPEGWQPRSYTFGVTTNHSFMWLKGTGEDPKEFLPTLVLYYDKGSELSENAKLAIAHLKRDGETTTWKEIATVQPEGEKYKYIAAAPLNQNSAPGLFKEHPEQLHTEYFRLFLMPK